MSCYFKLGIGLVVKDIQGERLNTQFSLAIGKINIVVYGARTNSQLLS